MKHVEVSVLARGRADGKHALHISETVFYGPCSAISTGTVNRPNHIQIFSYSVKSAIRMASSVKHAVITSEELPWPE